MPGATPKQAFPYPTGSETPQGPSAIQALAVAVENAYPFDIYFGTVSVSVSASTGGSVALNLPGGVGVPTVVMLTSRDTNYNVSHTTPYSGPPAGTTVNVLHIQNTSATTTVVVDYLAVVAL